MSLVLKNAAEVAQLWVTMRRHPDLILICIRHAEKVPNSTLRCGLTPRGEQQARLYHAAITPALEINRERGYRFMYAANTGRTIATVSLVKMGRLGGNVITHPSLDITDCGPNEEDLATARELAERLNITPNAAFVLRFEDYGFTRVGESPEQSRLRIRRGLIKEIGRPLPGSPPIRPEVTYCGNSPIMNEAVGVDGVLPELGTLFLALDSEEFRLLGRVDPIFEDVAD